MLCIEKHLCLLISHVQDCMEEVYSVAGGWSKQPLNFLLSLRFESKFIKTKFNYLIIAYKKEKKARY